MGIWQMLLLSLCSPGSCVNNPINYTDLYPVQFDDMKSSNVSILKFLRIIEGEVGGGGGWRHAPISQKDTGGG